MINKKKKLFMIYVFILLAFLFGGILIIKNLKIYLKYSELNLQYEQISSKIAKEIEKNKKTKKKLENLETEKGQIRILVEKNNLKRPGEKVIKILDY